MHDALYEREPTLVDRQRLLEIAESVGLDTERFERDLDDPKLQQRVQEDLADGRRNGVRATPTIFIDGIRYDGAWDFYSMLEALKPPIAAQVKRTARAFANLPQSRGRPISCSPSSPSPPLELPSTPISAHMMPPGFSSAWLSHSQSASQSE
jgi:Na+:H+ antiporter, NhaA family